MRLECDCYCYCAEDASEEAGGDGVICGMCIEGEHQPDDFDYDDDYDEEDE